MDVTLALGINQDSGIMFFTATHVVSLKIIFDEAIK